MMLVTMVLAGAIALGCQCARWYLEWEGRKESEHWGGRVKLTALRNSGAAFGLLPLSGKWLAAASAVVLTISAALYRGCRMGCALILGGGLSNLWERVRHGSVFDYIAFPKAPEKVRRYVFNLADFAIFVGTVIVLLSERKKKR